MLHSWIQNMLIAQAAGKKKKGGGDLIYLPTAEFHLITLLEADFIPACRLGSEDLFCASLAGTLKTCTASTTGSLGNLK